MKCQEDGEIDEPTDGVPTDSDAHHVVPNKVHIRGLDQLDQNQLKAYVVSHVGGKGADRIEWVNDTSANLVFSTDSAAHEALLALSAIEIADATQLSPGEVLAAKAIADRPEVALQVRYALESDKKERGAAQKSRFYLFHPEWDPETEEGRRKRDRQYRDRRDGDRYRRGGRNRRDERDDEEPEPFDVNLYDDDAGALARRTRYSPRRDDRQRRRDSRSRSANSRDDRRQSINRDKELFPSSRNRDTLRSDRGSYGRGRSASPTRDDRDAIEADLARDREAVRNNREKARSIKERIYTSSKSKELFPTDESRELFPSAGEKKELFPERGNGVSRAAMDQVPNDVLESMRCFSYDGAVDLIDWPAPCWPALAFSMSRIVLAST